MIKLDNDQMNVPICQWASSSLKMLRLHGGLTACRDDVIDVNLSIETEHAVNRDVYVILFLTIEHRVNSTGNFPDNWWLTTGSVPLIVLITLDINAENLDNFIVVSSHIFFQIHSENCCECLFRYEYVLQVNF